MFTAEAQAYLPPQMEEVFSARGFTLEEAEGGIVHYSSTLRYGPAGFLEDPSWLAYNKSFTAGLGADGTIKAIASIDGGRYLITPTLLEAWILMKGLDALIRTAESDLEFTTSVDDYEKYEQLQRGFSNFFYH